jgi:galactose-1-phosphate uridylyltransferase
MTKIKKCKDCGKPRDHDNPLISRCKKCQYGRDQITRTPVALVWKKRKERIQKEGSEVSVYKKVFAKRKHCVICSQEVDAIEGDLPPSWCFAHILAKKNYPHLRLFPNNIAFVCSLKCHAEVDSRVAGENKKEIEKRIVSGEEIYFYL